MRIFERLGKLLSRMRGEPAPAASAPSAPAPASNDEQSPTAQEEFLYFGRELAVVSSNVQSYRYDWQERVLYVRFKGHGSLYRYDNVSPEMAEAFGNAPSKGKAIWNEYRRPKRPYEFVESEDGHVPQREAPESQKGRFGTGARPVLTQRTRRLARERARFQARFQRQGG